MGCRRPARGRRVVTPHSHISAEESTRQLLVPRALPCMGCGRRARWSEACLGRPCINPNPQTLINLWLSLLLPDTICVRTRGSLDASCSGFVTMGSRVLPSRRWCVPRGGVQHKIQIAPNDFSGVEWRRARGSEACPGRSSWPLHHLPSLPEAFRGVSQGGSGSRWVVIRAICQ
jgi:hypothetical protein